MRKGGAESGRNWAIEMSRHSPASVVIIEDGRQAGRQVHGVERKVVVCRCSAYMQGAPSDLMS